MKKILSLIILGAMLLSLTTVCFADTEKDTSKNIADVSKWKNIVQVQLGQDYIIGLKSDGTAVCAGNVPEWINIKSWKNIVQIERSPEELFIAGLKSDGTAVLCGNKDAYSDVDSLEKTVETWSGVSSLSSGYYATLAGLKDENAGQMEETGTQDWNTAAYFRYTSARDIHYGGSWLAVMDFNGNATVCYDGSVGKTYKNVADVEGMWHTFILNENGTVSLPDGLSENDSAKKWKDIEQFCVNDTFDKAAIAAVNKNGELMINNYAQEVFGDVELEDVASVEMNDNYLAAVKEDGSVKLYAAGSGESESAKSGISMCTDWEDIEQICACNSFICGLKSDGKVVLAGDIPEGIDVSDWEDIEQIVCNPDTPFIAGLKSDGTVIMTYVDELVEYGFDADDVAEWKDIGRLSAGFNMLCGFNENTNSMPNYAEAGGVDFNSVEYFHYMSIKDVWYGMTWMVVVDDSNIGTFAADGYIYEKYFDVASVCGRATMYILYTDGTVGVREENEEYLSECLSWKNIVQISAESDYGEGLAGINKKGSLVLDSAAKEKFGDIELSNAKYVYLGTDYMAVLLKDGTVKQYNADIDATSM